MTPKKFKEVHKVEKTKKDDKMIKKISKTKTYETKETSLKASRRFLPWIVGCGIGAIVIGTVVPIAVILTANGNDSNKNSTNITDLQKYLNETLTIKPPEKGNRDIAQLEELVDESVNFISEFNDEMADKIGVLSNLSQVGKPKDVVLYYKLVKSSTVEGDKLPYELMIKARTTTGLEWDKDPIYLESANSYKDINVSQEDLYSYINHDFVIADNIDGAKTINHLDNYVLATKLNNNLPFDEQVANELGVFAEIGFKPDAIKLTYSLDVIKNELNTQKEYRLSVTGRVENFAPQTKTITIASGDVVTKVTTQSEFDHLVELVSHNDEISTKTIADLNAIVEKSNEFKPLTQNFLDSIGSDSNIMSLNWGLDVKLSYRFTRTGEQIIGSQNEYVLELRADVLGRDELGRSIISTMKSSDEHSTSEEELAEIIEYRLTTNEEFGKTYEELDALVASSSEYAPFTSEAATSMGISSNIGDEQFLSSLPSDVTINYRLTSSLHVTGYAKLYTLSIVGITDSRKEYYRSAFHVRSSNSTFKTQEDLDNFMESITISDDPNLRRYISQLDSYVTSTADWKDFERNVLILLRIQSNLFSSLTKPSDISLKYKIVEKGGDIHGQIKEYKLIIKGQTNYQTSYSKEVEFSIFSKDTVNKDQKDLDKFVSDLTITTPSVWNTSFAELDAIVASTEQGALFNEEVALSLGLTSNIKALMDELPANIVVKYRLVRTKEVVESRKKYELQVFASSTLSNATSVYTPVIIESSDIFVTTSEALNEFMKTVYVDSPFPIVKNAVLDTYITQPNVASRFTIASANQMGLNTNINSVANLPTDVFFEFKLEATKSIAGQRKEYSFTLIGKTKGINGVAVSAPQTPITIISQDVVTSTTQALQNYVNTIVVSYTTPKTIEQLDDIVLLSRRWKGYLDADGVSLGIDPLDLTGKPGDSFVSYQLVEKQPLVVNQVKSYELFIKVASINGNEAISQPILLTSSDNYTNAQNDLEIFMTQINVNVSSALHTILQLDALTEASKNKLVFDAQAESTLGVSSNISSLARPIGSNITFEYMLEKRQTIAGQRNVYELSLYGTNVDGSETAHFSLEVALLNSSDVHETTQDELDELVSNIQVIPAHLPNRTIANLDALVTGTEATLTSTKLQELGVSTSFVASEIPVDVTFTYTLSRIKQVATVKNEYQLVIKARTTNGAYSGIFESEVESLKVISSDVYKSSLAELTTYVDGLTVTGSTKSFTELDELVIQSANWKSFGPGSLLALGIDTSYTTNTPAADFTFEYKLERGQRVAGQKAVYNLKVRASVKNSTSVVTKDFALTSQNLYSTTFEDLQQLINQVNNPINSRSTKTYSALDTIVESSNDWSIIDQNFSSSLGITSNINSVSLPNDVKKEFKLIQVFEKATFNVVYTLTIRLSTNDDSYSTNKTFVVESSNEYVTTEAELITWMYGIDVSPISTQTYASLNQLLSASYVQFNHGVLDSLGLETEYNLSTLPLDVQLTYKLEKEGPNVATEKVNYKLTIKGNGNGIEFEVEHSFKSVNEYVTTNVERDNYVKGLKIVSAISSLTHEEITSSIDANPGTHLLTPEALATYGIDFKFEQNPQPADITLYYSVRVSSIVIGRPITFMISLSGKVGNSTSDHFDTIFISSNIFEADQSVMRNYIENFVVTASNGTYEHYDNQLVSQQELFTLDVMRTLNLTTNFDANTKPKNLMLKYTLTSLPKVEGARPQYYLDIFGYVDGEDEVLTTRKMLTATNVYRRPPQSLVSLMSQLTFARQSTKTIEELKSLRTDLNANGTIIQTQTRAFNSIVANSLTTTNFDSVSIPTETTFKYKMNKKFEVFMQYDIYDLAIIGSQMENGIEVTYTRNFEIVTADRNFTGARMNEYFKSFVLDENGVQHPINYSDYRLISTEPSPKWNNSNWGQYAELTPAVAEKYGIHFENAIAWKYPDVNNFFTWRFYSMYNYNSQAFPTYTPGLGNEMVWFTYFQNMNNNTGAPADVKGSGSNYVKVYHNVGKDVGQEIWLISRLRVALFHPTLPHNFNNINEMMRIPATGEIDFGHWYDDIFELLMPVMPTRMAEKRADVENVLNVQNYADWNPEFMIEKDERYANENLNAQEVRVYYKLHYKNTNLPEYIYTFAIDYLR